MDTPFDIGQWRPTNPSSHTTPWVTDEWFSSLTQRLRDQTRHLQRFPYDPNGWIRRAATLRSLQYPELAIGDFVKAQMLCDALLQRLHSENWRWQLGSRMGFWMREEEGRDGDHRDEASSHRHRAHSAAWTREINSVLALHEHAKIQLAMNLCPTDFRFPLRQEFEFLRRPYPWMSPRHLRRDDALLATLQEEIRLNAASRKAAGGAFCTIQRHAFGVEVDDEGGTTASESLGVFASRPIPKDTTILFDTATLFGCNGPGSAGDHSNLGGGRACTDALHPNLASDLAAHDLRWIRDRLGSAAADTILLCRALLTCVQAEETAAEPPHPLDHPLVARLAPKYLRADSAVGNVAADLRIPLQALQRFGVDVFAAPRFEAWVLFTLAARLANNAASDSLATAVYPLFSLFNHSCRPNVAWCSAPRRPARHCALRLEVTREVVAGEQLFVCYDDYISDSGLSARRTRLRHWLDGPCRCERCVEEEAEEAEVQREDTEVGLSDDGVGAWDVDVRPTLPEDE